jgi:cytochrome c
MPFRRITTVAFGLIFACIGTAPAQQDRATPQEVVQKVRQATQDLAKSGEAGLATFSSKNATSVWKDSYIFVLNCEGGKDVTAAHPIRPEFTGKPTAEALTFGPIPGEQIAAAFCAANGRRTANRRLI